MPKSIYLANETDAGTETPQGFDTPTALPPPVSKAPGRAVQWLLLGLLVIVLQAGVSLSVYAIFFNGSNGTDAPAPPLQEQAPPRPPGGGLWRTPAPPEEVPPSPQVAQGGGDATFHIVDVPRPSPAPSMGGIRRPLTVPQIAERVTPSVVSVVSTSSSGTGSGTGIIFTPDGYILTNAHVVTGAWGIQVILHDGADYEAVLIGSDATLDIAVIKIEAVGLTPAEFGNSDNLLPGDPVVVIGNPLGVEFQGTVTTGVISAVHRSLVVGGRTMQLLQTSASVNPGNSGGPLINEYGQVVGVINAKIMGDAARSIEGLGFAIPVTAVHGIIGDLVHTGFVPGRPRLGVTIDLTFRGTGLLVQSVHPNSDAHRKGLLADDIILAVNGTPVFTVVDVNNIIGEFKPGESLTFTIQRGSRTFDLDFELVDGGVLDRG